MRLNTLQCTGQSLTTKNYPLQRVNSLEVEDPELNKVHAMFNTTLGTYQLLGKRKNSNLEGWGGGVSRSRNMSLVAVDPQGAFPKHLAIRLLCSEEAHKEVV